MQSAAAACRSCCTAMVRPAGCGPGRATRRSPSSCCTSSAVTPTPDDVRRWIDDLAARGFRRVRTGALNAAQADLPDAASASTRSSAWPCSSTARPRDAPRPIGVHRQARRRRVRGGERRRPRRRSRAPWALDAAAIADVCAAPRTATGRDRSVDDGRLVAFAISGRDVGSGLPPTPGRRPGAPACRTRPPAGARQPALGGALALPPGARQHPRRQRSGARRCTPAPASSASTSSSSCSNTPWPAATDETSPRRTRRRGDRRTAAARSPPTPLPQPSTTCSRRRADARRPGPRSARRPATPSRSPSPCPAASISTALGAGRAG